MGDIGRQRASMPLVAVGRARGRTMYAQPAPMLLPFARAKAVRRHARTDLLAGSCARSGVA